MTGAPVVNHAQAVGDVPVVPPATGIKVVPRAATHGNSIGTVAQPITAPPNSAIDTSHYERLFPNLPPLVTDMAPLIALGMAGGPMDAGGSDMNLSTTIPAGFTYFGQFLDHNITFQAEATFELGNLPQSTENFRSGRVSLEHVYGLGPDTQAFSYYDAQRNGQFWLDPATPRDVPRNPAQGTCLIADPRNDNTVITIQLHLALMRFHNALVGMLPPGTDPDQVFATAHQIAVWHWQWLVVNDFLPLILEPTVYADLVANGPRYYVWQGGISLPVEFTVAAYRLHPLVRQGYALNATTSGDLFKLRTPFQPLTQEQIIDWSYFFDFGDGKVQYAKRFEPKIASTFLQMPGPIDTPLEWPADVPADTALRSIAVRNLLRSRAFGLPSGQTVAAHLGHTPLTQEEIGLADSGLPEAPLWYYVMAEALAQTGGATLGLTGSRIVGDVFFGMLLGDPNSYLSVFPNWTPTLGTNGEFHMTDLLTIAGVHP